MKYFSGSGFRNFLLKFNIVFSLIVITTQLYDFGYPSSLSGQKNIHTFYQIAAIVYLLNFIGELISERLLLLRILRENPLKFAFHILGLIVLMVSFSNVSILIQDLGFISSNLNIETALIVFLNAYLLLNSLIIIVKLRENWLFVSANPSKVLFFSFGILILTGTLLLKLPACSNYHLSWPDALFTATSAVCVTGLSTINIAYALTFKGQIILMLLIQAGGLSIITLTTFIALFFRRGFKLKDQLLLQYMFSDENISFIENILKIIIGVTLIIETFGAISFFFSWQYLHLSSGQRLFHAVFHAVSAYCNAGFSVFPNGFEENFLSTSYPTLITAMILIILGGIGFYTISDIFKFEHKEHFNIRPKGLRLQTRIILSGTGILIITGAVLIWFFQYPEWKNLPVGQQIIYSLFNSVTSRTAGFSCYPVSKMAIPSALIIILLMFIGASPNGTAGGIKITTFYTVILAFFSFSRGKERVTSGWNTIPMTLVRKAFIVFFASISLIFIAVLLISSVEKKDFFDILFETVSAFGTVGLSRGITPFLTDFSKIVLVCVMYLGRVGLYSLAIAVTDELGSNAYKFPETSLMIG
ncbi:MAG TPA: potassium transporter TrkG [Bacteroidia bacterium]|nr:potassium transporter TrkG [Bacteroidia bacterium]HRS57585.1 potassium transporter TrkG [Bacteroidia bacterium]